MKHIKCVISKQNSDKHQYLVSVYTIESSKTVFSIECTHFDLTSLQNTKLRSKDTTTIRHIDLTTTKQCQYTGALFSVGAESPLQQHLSKRPQDTKQNCGFPENCYYLFI